MKSGFFIVGLTPPLIRDDESEVIASRLDDGSVDYFHLRHPDASPQEMARIIEAIPQRLRRRLTLHDHHFLAPDYGVGGLHLNSRNPELPQLPGGYRPRVSRSCHSIEELALCHSLDYATLSPIFDSISKQGYTTAFPPERYRNLAMTLARIPVKTVALGGVTPDRLPLLRSLGFAGAAMLGALWPSPDS